MSCLPFGETGFPPSFCKVSHVICCHTAQSRHWAPIAVAPLDAVVANATVPGPLDTHGLRGQLLLPGGAQMQANKSSARTSSSFPEPGFKGYTDEGLLVLITHTQ